MTAVNHYNHKRIKILYIQVPPAGGSLIALYEMVNHLDKQLIEPVILCYYKNKFSTNLEAIEGCRVIYLFENLGSPVINSSPGKSYNSIINYLNLQLTAIKKILFSDKTEVRKLYEVIIKEKPDIIHHNNDILLNRNCVRAANKTNIAQIIHNRSLAGYGNNRADFFLDRLLIKKINFHINITQAVSNHFNTLFRLPGCNSVVMHDVIDINRYKPAEANIALKNELGIKDGEHVITCIGRLTKWKGQHVLIEAVNLLRNQFPKIKVLLVGPDDEGAGSRSYADKLKQMIADYRLEDIIILTGNRTDIPEIINISDIIVHTSIKPEPQGLVIVEALLCRKKVIASNTFGSGELINKYGGIPLKPVNAETLASLLLQERRNKEAKNSCDNEITYKRLRKDFDPGQQSASIIRVYKKILNNV